MKQQRKHPVGAEVLAEGGASFRIWAPARRTAEIILEGGAASGPEGVVEMTPEPGGYFSAIVPQAAANTLYRFRLDSSRPNNGTERFPDPASRFQPQGPHGPSQVVDPASFRWTDGEWQGVGLEGQVIYELHVGTFTPEGTWQAAARELPELAALGITVIEAMPVADFPGRFGWGYDGVNLFAPTRLYGPPDDFRSFVDQAHAAGMGVILDVVYNHIGPDGNYLKQFSPDYFTDRYQTDWGEPINFDGENAGPVREFFLANAAYWIDEFHLDGLRLDATQSIFDQSSDHILAAVVRRVRQAAGGRRTLIVAENEEQETRLARPAEQNGYGIDALWNDDFHHTAMVALTGRNEAYYTDYLGTPQEFISAAKWGYLYQGQPYSWQKQCRGTPGLDLAPAQFVTFIENHDQVANSAKGLHVGQLSSPARYRAMTALLLLSPGTPMLFQGQEFAASTPFFFFADHHEELARLVAEGRKKFLTQFPSLALEEMQASVPDPSDPDTFARSKLDPGEREKHAEVYAMHRDLLRLRREDPAFRSQQRRGVDGAILSPQVFVLRYFVAGGDDRLLVINLGRDLKVSPAPEPLLAPPLGCRWNVLWSSEDACYGGCGTPDLGTDVLWTIPGDSAVALIPQPRTQETSHG